jgi:hypothetical protein
VWFFGKKEKPKGRKRSIIGADIIAKLKAERKGARREEILSATGSQSAL